MNYFYNFTVTDIYEIKIDTNKQNMILVTYLNT